MLQTIMSRVRRLLKHRICISQRRKVAVSVRRALDSCVVHSPPLDVRCRASSPPHACIAKTTSRTVVLHLAATPSFLPCSRACLHGRAVHHVRTMLLISRCHPRPSHRQLGASRIHPTPVAHALLWQTTVVQGSSSCYGMHDSRL